MSYTTTYWETGYEWNGVIYPTQLSDIKFTRRTYDAGDLIINHDHTHSFSDDIRCSLSLNVDNSKKSMSKAIADIDKIRKVEVPIWLYLFIYFLGMLLAFGLSYIMLGVLRLFIWLAAILVVFLVLGITFAMTCITYVSFEEEESNDSKELAMLYNKIKRERIS